VRSRDSVTSGQRDALVRALDAIPWSRRQHAYGEASDVAAELYAITLGDAEARTAAWWELWGTSITKALSTARPSMWFR
jgi:hypothetical protein